MRRSHIRQPPHEPATVADRTDRMLSRVRDRLGPQRIGGAWQSLVWLLAALAWLIPAAVLASVVTHLASGKEEALTLLLAVPMVGLLSAVLWLPVRVLASGVVVRSGETVILNPWRTRVFPTADVRVFTLDESVGRATAEVSGQRPIHCYGLGVHWPRRATVRRLVREANEALAVHRPDSGRPAFRPGARVRVSGGYDGPDSKWLRGGDGYRGTIVDLGPQTASVELDEELVLEAEGGVLFKDFGEGSRQAIGEASTARGRWLVLMQAWVEGQWAGDSVAPLQVGLCATRPDLNRIPSGGGIGFWVESHASCRLEGPGP